MSGRYRALFLLAVLFWQSLALLSSLSLVQHARENADPAYAVRHAFYQHHVDQTVHKSGEADAASHSHAGAMADVAAVIDHEPVKMLALHRQHAIGTLAVARQAPYLAGLLRPPQNLT